ncbi:hypothetical protein [Streptococcus suis]|nr:hypothetical protein [Streptococcus suis]MDG3136286.1 hypothetical protein [Streptococcus suis]
MKKLITILLIIITLFGTSQIPVTTTFEDGSTYQETLIKTIQLLAWI